MKESMSKFAYSSSSTSTEGLIIRGCELERKSKQGSRGNSKSWFLHKTCNYYKKKGHINYKCYKLQNKNKREQSQS